MSSYIYSPGGDDKVYTRPSDNELFIAMHKLIGEYDDRPATLAGLLVAWIRGAECDAILNAAYHLPGEDPKGYLLDRAKEMYG